MKTLISSVIALALMVSIPCMAQAKGNKGGDKPFHGKVTAVDATANTITVESKKSAESKTFKAADAKITVDGAAGKLADITVGMKAKVTVGTTPDTATAIDASTHKKHDKKAKS